MKHSSPSGAPFGEKCFLTTIFSFIFSLLFKYTLAENMNVKDIHREYVASLSREVRLIRK